MKEKEDQNRGVFWNYLKGKVRSLWYWWKENSEPFVAIGTILVAIGTILLALTTFLHIQEAQEMRTQTKRLADLSVKEFQMRAYPSFLIAWDKVYVESENLFQSLKIHNKGEMAAHGATFLLVNSYKEKNSLSFSNLIGVHYKDKEWKRTVNVETKIFREGHKVISSKFSFPQNHSIETLKHALLYIKFKIPYDDKPHFESFGYFLKKDFMESNLDKQYYFWQEVDINLKNKLIKKHLEEVETSQAKEMEILRAFFEGYHGTQGEFKN